MSKGSKRKISVFSGICVLTILLVVTIYSITKNTPDFDKLSDEEVLGYVSSGKPKTLNNEQLTELGERFGKIPFEKSREVMNGLDEEGKSNLRNVRRLIAEAVMTKTLDEFFSLPPDKQDEFLDKQIEQMNERRQEFMQRFRTARGTEGSGPISPRGSTQQGERRQFFEGGRVGENAGESGEFHPGARRPVRMRPSPEAMLQRRRDRLSESTPEERAKRREYFRRLMERRFAHRRG